MSTNPQEDVYKEYLNYDWKSFTEFQDGLQEILDNYLANLKEQDASVTSIPSLDKQQLIDQAKSFFFCNKTGHILNLDDFNEWKLHNGDKYIRSGQIEEQTETAEPKTTEKEDDDEPYTSNYQELVELIALGKPIPGIKQIPDTVLTGEGSAASAAQRKKPWERNKPVNAGDETVTTESAST
ncbi:hypothetical protein Cantr_07037 [Candida viswanathii]|uniref:Uncharacterized protein n=1 Tax=Candida viswanathii TaxID=5486 RepID=A0A367Y021_9ASCO|nr:hypothetical protein Cantr_07037 [Candida viswanathii]